MPEIEMLLSTRESEELERYAKQQKITGEEAISRLAISCVERRLSPRIKHDVDIRAFELPKRS
jgi:hypothetical protein